MFLTTKNLTVYGFHYIIKKYQREIPKQRNDLWKIIADIAAVH